MRGSIFSLFLASEFDVFCFLVYLSSLGLCVFAKPAFSRGDAFSLQTDISQRNCYRCKLFTFHFIHLTVISHVFFVFAFALFSTIICIITCLLWIHIFMVQVRYKYIKESMS